MKRFLALALVLCMALSMMVLTASALSFSCPEHNCYFECDNGNHEVHFYISNITGDSVDFCEFYETIEVEEHFTSVPTSTFTGYGITPVARMVVADVDGIIVFCQMLDSPAQPKTGVMDTLPLWFGVMAVSACAYVLTSKKKVF